MNLNTTIYMPLMALLCTSCAVTSTATGEPGISIGDSYESVFKALEKDNRITKAIDGQGIRAEGFSAMTKDCRTKLFVFQGKAGLQLVKYEPAPQLSVAKQCK